MEYEMCRLCLDKNDSCFFSIYDVTVTPNIPGMPKLKLAMMISECIGTYVCSTDGLPKLICFRCWYLIEKYYTFKKQCQKNERRLQREQGGTLLTHTEKMIEWKQSSTSIHTITSPVEESLEAEKSVESIVPSEFETIDGEVLITSESDNEVEKKSQEKQDEHSSNRVLKKIKTDVSVEKSSPLPPCTVVLEKISSTNKSTESKTSESNVAEEIPTVNKNAKEKSLKFKRKFPCEHCGQTFALSFLLKRHLNQLHKKKYYKCETCHRKFSTNNSLISHLFQHPDWKPCVCPKCKKTFQESNALKKHITNNMCLNNTANMKQSNNHESRNLIQPNKTQDEPKNIGFNTIHKLGGVLCKVCGNSYWTEEELTIHSALHVNQKELFLCELCIRNFEEKTTLECPHQVSENIH